MAVARSSSGAGDRPASPLRPQPAQPAAAAPGKRRHRAAALHASSTTASGSPSAMCDSREELRRAEGPVRSACRRSPRPRRSRRCCRSRTRRASRPIAAIHAGDSPPARSSLRLRAAIDCAAAACTKSPGPRSCWPRKRRMKRRRPALLGTIAAALVASCRRRSHRTQLAARPGGLVAQGARRSSRPLARAVRSAAAAAGRSAAGTGRPLRRQAAHATC